MTGFDIFLRDPDVDFFSEPEVAAERIYHIDPVEFELNLLDVMEKTM